MIHFEKYQGLGNDFILVDENEWLVDQSASARKLCARHTGIGADGVIAVSVGTAHDFEMRVFNADGSEAKMCGNGIRCVGLYLYRKGLITVGRPVDIKTASGPHRLTLRDASLDAASVEVVMTTPQVLGSKEVSTSKTSTSDRQQLFTLVDVGNLHAVVSDMEPSAELAGEIQESHGAINVGFVKRAGSELTLTVYEHGVGFTEACGTGACAATAAFVASHELGYGQWHVVAQPGGRLEIRWPGDNAPIEMRGPASFVFEGTLPT